MKQYQLLLILCSVYNNYIIAPAVLSTRSVHLYVVPGVYVTQVSCHTHTSKQNRIKSYWTKVTKLSTCWFIFMFSGNPLADSSHMQQSDIFCPLLANKLNLNSLIGCKCSTTNQLYFSHTLILWLLCFLNVQRPSSKSLNEDGRCISWPAFRVMCSIVASSPIWSNCAYHTFRITFHVLFCRLLHMTMTAVICFVCWITNATQGCPSWMHPHVLTLMYCSWMIVL